MTLETARQTPSAGALVSIGHHRDRCSERDIIKQVIQAH